MLCESLKLTLQSYSLSAAGRRLDALTFVMLVAPLVLLALAELLLALHIFWPTRPEALTLPPWRALRQNWWLLAANGCLAFAMNVAHALFIKRSSATAFVLTGVIMKDVLIVVVGTLVLGELLSPLQVTGFVMQMAAILVWSLMKVAPTMTLTCPDGPDAKAPEGWQELQLEDGGKAMSPAAATPDAERSHRFEAGVALVKPSRRPASPGSRSSQSTMPPLNEEDSYLSDGISHCGEGL
mmetsp:Transcript_12928/g.40800  ORF Transcript_12928/g.40800 Transcript_12928/m.40800 type:complete len:239 (-) Transcript_12928:356-1072(-)